VGVSRRHIEAFPQLGASHTERAALGLQAFGRRAAGGRAAGWFGCLMLAQLTEASRLLLRRLPAGRAGEPRPLFNGGRLDPRRCSPGGVGLFLRIVLGSRRKSPDRRVESTSYEDRTLWCWAVPRIGGESCGDGVRVAFFRGAVVHWSTSAWPRVARRKNNGALRRFTIQGMGVECAARWYVRGAVSFSVW